MYCQADSARCINANPDICGIGVRIAIYMQGLLAVLTLCVYMADGVVTRQEYKSAVWQTFALGITACAILVSTVIQAARDGLDPYHGFIVLHLGWISCLGLGLLPLFARSPRARH